MTDSSGDEKCCRDVSSMVEVKCQLLLSCTFPNLLNGSQYLDHSPSGPEGFLYAWVSWYLKVGLIHPFKVTTYV